MKKRFPAIILALALCFGLTIPAFAADTVKEEPVTVNNITMSGVVVTDKYETFPEDLFDFSEGFYNLGMVGFYYEELEDYGYETFGCFIIPDDAVITFDLTEEKSAAVLGYTIKETEDSSSSGKSYDAAFTGGVEPTDPADSITLTKDQLDGELQVFIPEYDFLICRVGEGAWVFIMFAGSTAALGTPDESNEPAEPAEPAEPDEPTEPAEPEFTDVPAWCADAVNWAKENNVTTGATPTTFAPGKNCTQVQILTFLWRAKDRPESDATEFSDLAGDYAPAANWAYENGLIDDSFDPNADCTRAQAVSYIWQVFEQPEAEASSFSDVDADADYAKAVDWAVENGITNGYENSDGSFSFRPDTICNRGVIVTLLYRAFGEEAGA